MKKLIKKIIKEEVQKAQSFVNKDGKLSNFSLSDYDKGAINQLKIIEDLTKDYRTKNMIFTYFTDVVVYKSKEKGSISNPNVKIEVVRLTGNFIARGFSKIIPKENQQGNKMLEVEFKKMPVAFQITENSSSYPLDPDELPKRMIEQPKLIYGFNRDPKMITPQFSEEDIYNRSDSLFITPKNIEAIEFIDLLTDIIKNSK